MFIIKIQNKNNFFLNNFRSFLESVHDLKRKKKKNQLQSKSSMRPKKMKEQEKSIF